MAVVQTSALKQTDDITECPVCFEPFADPRSLPCVHTFCLKCITGYSHDTQPGDQMPCPICNKQFTIPCETGLNGLPKNFFIEKLLQIKQVSNNEKTVQCEVCEAQSGDESEKTTAAKYCVECQQKLCNSCAKVHGTYRMLRGHNLISFEDLKGPKGQDIFRTSLPTGCQKHRDQALSIFCNDCKMAACVVCYIASHKQHNCSDIDDVIGEFRKQMTNDIGSLAGGMKKLDDLQMYVEQLERNLAEYATETEEVILQRAEELHKRIEQNKQTLINELTTKKGDVAEQLNDLSLKITQQMSLVGCLKKYTEELCSKGAAGDVARETSVLHDRTEELLDFRVIERSRNRMDSIKVKLTGSALTNGNNDNLIGDVLVEVIPKNAVLTHVIPAGSYQVVGVTSLASQLFVVRNQPQQIEVYDTATFTLQRNISVPGLQYAYGLASCRINNCLYASNSNANNVCRTELSNTAAVTNSNWAVGPNPKGLSVSTAGNVLVACSGGNVIQEYATRGSLIRQLSLQQSGITNPQHSIQLTNDRFVVSHQHRVCIINAAGGLVSSYGSTVAGSGDGQLSGPQSLAALKNGCILIADCNNNKIKIWNPMTNQMRDLPLPTDTALQGPYALGLDEDRGQLFIGEQNGRRVVVFEVFF